MLSSVQQYYYTQLQDPTTSSTDPNPVDTFWLNLLPDYFRKTQIFGSERQSRFLPHAHVDATFRLVRSGGRRRIVLLLLMMMPGGGDGVWDEGLDRLTEFLGLVRDEEEESQGGVVYGAVNVGAYTRFYEFLPGEGKGRDFTESDGQGRVLEVLWDEEMVHRILEEIVQRTREG
nr:hypothetical protein CFP56_57605 [Quercus suber]